MEDEKKKFNKEEFFRILKFTAFSISAGVIQFATTSLLNEVIHLSYWPSYLIGLVLSVIWNFTFNRKFTFKSANNVPIAMLLVLAYYCVFTPISTFGAEAIEASGWPGMLVTVIMMLLNFVTEFIWQRFVVFRGSINTNVKEEEVTISEESKEEKAERKQTEKKAKKESKGQLGKINYDVIAKEMAELEEMRKNQQNK